MVDEKFLKDWELNNWCITQTHYSLIKNGDLEYHNSFTETVIHLIEHVVDCINKAEKGLSKINPKLKSGKELLEFEGYTGTKTRHFYNNICSKQDTRYLEIGTWNGSSSIAAVYKNNITGLFIDNWCQFGGSSDLFIENISKYGNGSSSISFIESDCWKVDLSQLNGTFNVYLYDGDHSELDHFKALEYYLPVLDDQFIFLVDDWNWFGPRDGTMRAIRELNLKIRFRHEIFMSPDDLLNMPNHIGKQTWWNGIGIFVLEK